MQDNLNEKAKVVLKACDSYDKNEVYTTVRALIGAISFDSKDIEGKRVVIKPNLVRKMDISAAGTTNPTVVETLSRVLLEMGASSVTIAESPAGPYTESALRASYKAGRMDEAAEASGAALNYDLGASRVLSTGADKERAFNMIDPIANAELVVNICKLKTHNLTGMSGAVKNFFGVVPGTEKLEMHALYPNLTDFSGMICDLCKTVCDRTAVLNVMDGIVAMEGNGPTNGKPKKLGFLGASRDPFALDEVCSEIIGMKGLSSIGEEAKKRGFLPEIERLGDTSESFVCADFQLPDSSDRKHSAISVLSGLFGGRVMESLRPRPVIDQAKCVGCGECMRSCPAKTIVIKNRVASIKKKACIKCFCCQELCPKDAVKVRKNPLLKLVGLFT